MSLESKVIALAQAIGADVKDLRQQLGVMTNTITAVLADKGTALADSVSYITPIEIPITGTAIRIRARTFTGTVNVGFKVNGAAVGTVNATFSGVDTVISYAVTSGSLLTVDLSNSNGNGLTISMEIQ